MPGLVNFKYPESSGLELSESEYEPGRVILMAPDIRAQATGARLVFLSATRTTEDPRTGYASQPGLVADFLTAGAASVIVNFWAGDGGADTHFVTDYYRHLKETENIADALRKTKLEHMKSRRENGIYDWAGYQLYIR
jgi:CHAT domain-containing protein